MKKTSYILYTFLLFIFLCCACSAKLLLTGVSLEDSIPDNFYGSWEVTSKRLETNNPALFNAYSVDNWTFARQGKFVVISNPQNNASVTINIESVSGDKITFSRKTDKQGYIQKETCKIKLEDDTFYGTDTILFEHYKNNKIVMINVVKYNIVGRKISGSGLTNFFKK